MANGAVERALKKVTLFGNQSAYRQSGMATGTITKVMNDSNTGYCKMPDGTLIQWGILANTSNGYNSVSFHYAFFDDNYIFQSAPRYSASYSSLSFRTIGQKNGQTGGIINFKQLTSTASYTGTDALADWLAIGRWK